MSDFEDSGEDIYSDDDFNTTVDNNSGKIPKKSRKTCPPKRYPCTECANVFPYGYKLKEHQIRKHSPLKQHIICTYGSCKTKRIRLGGKQAYFGHVERFHPEVQTSECVIRYVYPLGKGEFATIHQYTYDSKEKKPSDEREAFKLAYGMMLSQYGESHELNDTRDENRRALSISQTIASTTFKAHLLAPIIQSGNLYTSIHPDSNHSNF